jgi:hypothetical protein
MRYEPEDHVQQACAGTEAAPAFRLCLLKTFKPSSDKPSTTNRGLWSIDCDRSPFEQIAHL